MLRIFLIVTLLALPQVSSVQYSVSRAPEVEFTFVVTRGVLPVVEPVQNTVVGKARRKVVILHTAVWCAPCKAAKKALTKEVLEKLPFDIEIRDSVEYEYPHPIPAFHWDSPNGPMKLEGWYGVEHLENEFKRTQQKIKSVIRNPLQGNYQHFGVRGMSMEYHVRHDHGINTSGMTAQEIQQAHNAAHAGISAQQINDYMRNRSK